MRARAIMILLRSVPDSLARQLEWQPAEAGAAGRRADARAVRAVRGMSDAEEREFGAMLAPATMLAPEACVVLVRARETHRQ